METIRHSVFLLAAQVIVAAALSGLYATVWVRRRGTRRERATWFRAARALLRLTPAAVALFLGGAAWALWNDLPLPHFGLIFWVGATIPLTAGLRWMLRAADLQDAARIAPCRRLARLAGRATAGGAVVGMAALFTVPVAGARAWFVPGLAAGLIVVGGYALLAGLSGKPRPAGGIGTLLWLAAWIAVIHVTVP